MRSSVRFMGFFTSCILVALMSFSGCGGGAPAAPSTTLSGNTSVTLLATSTANDQLSQFDIGLNSVTLTGDSGNTVKLFTTLPVAEFIHVNGTLEPLQTVSVPQGIYTSATVSVGSSSFVCNGFDASNKLLYSSDFSDQQVPSSAVTVNLPSPITITGTAMGLSLDLLVSQSTSWGTCDPNSNASSPFSITPTFNLTPVDISAQPTNSANGRVLGLHGLVTSVDASGTGFSVTAADGPCWQVTTSANTVYQGITDFSQLAAGMPVDMDGVLQADGSLLVTRVAVYDKNTASLSVSSGPLLYVVASQPTLSTMSTEEQGYLPAAIGSTAYSFGHAIFQTSGQLTSVPNLPFPTSFTAANMVAGQNVFLTTHALTMQGGPTYTPASTITLLPQTINGTVSAMGSSGSFTTYTITLAPYDLFPALAVQPGQTTLLTNPSQVVVYVDNNTQMLNTQPIAVGNVTRFYGLVFNDSGTLRMDCAQINDGVK